MKGANIKSPTVSFKHLCQNNFCLLLLFCGVILSCNQPKNERIKIVDEVNLPATKFALTELNKALETKGRTLVSEHQDITLKISIDPIGLLPEEFTITNKKNDSIYITGGDKSGVMYGVLELAEQLSFGKSIGDIKEITQKPFIAKRGVKINFPLDGRLPSYDDTGDAAQENIEQMWSLEFWKAHIDELAKNRYNLITLWSKHPFPGMLKLDKYPKAAIEDVYVLNRDKVKITPQTSADWRGINKFDYDNLTLVKKMSIEEKTAFWQEVMQYGHDRGIEFIFFTWNIFFSNADKVYKMDRNSEEAVLYMRETIKEFVKTFPHVAGFGVTAGENMGNMNGGYTKVQWLYETYGKGVAEAIKESPGRDFRFIFRRHGTTLPAIDKDFKPGFPGLVETGYKYSQSHAYSNEWPKFYERDYFHDVEKYNYHCWMHLRNEDLFCFRWGDPDFVRTYLQNMKQYNPPGFFMGSDGYVWGREFTSKNPALSGQLEIEKHWLRFASWGRLAYNPTLGQHFFEKKMKAKFPEVNEKDLYQSWQNASKVIPLTTNFHWQSLDAMWAPEACMDVDGFHSVYKFIDSYANEPDKVINIPNYVDKMLEQQEIKRITPLQMADSILHFATQSHKYLEQLEKERDNYSEELMATLDDIKCQALLGDYYGNKIYGATYLRFLETVDGSQAKEEYREKSIKALEKALVAWKQLAEIAENNYKSQLLARTEYLEWQSKIEDVERDIELVKNSNGKPPRVAKIIYAPGWFRQDNMDRLEEALINANYKVKKVKWWFVDGQATGLNLVICDYNSKNRKFLEDRGGVIPADDIEKNGYTIVEYANKHWVFCKDLSHLNKTVDYLITQINENRIDINY